jgi:hypothetical protein
VEIRDLIVTPLLIFVVYATAYFIRPYVTDAINYRYYFPALTLKLFGAIALGLVYQFYYGGGDTFAYHTHGSRPIWEAFMESPSRGFELLFSTGDMSGRNWNISSKIWYFRDQHSFFIIRISSIFDLITFSTYSATACLFAVVSFIGGWTLFGTFYKRYPEAHRWLALSCLFVPSVIFWGSGILKDTITLAFLSMATWSFDRLFIQRRISFSVLLLLFLSCFVIYAVKIYILMSFLVAAVVWLFAAHFFRIKSVVARMLTIPFVMVAVAIMVYFGVNQVVSDDPRYSIDKLAETVMITAYDIRYWTGKDAGSGYALGELDGSIGSVVRLAPAAINVSLFRPYLWEVNNPFMLLSSLESMLTLFVSIFVIIKLKRSIFHFLQKPEVIFCLTFALFFAFGVGVSTYNFGTLARYKIPLMPFYFIGMGVLYYSWKSERNTSELAFTE